jgi:hypothetical protein
MATKPEGGRFDEDTYKRAYEFVKRGGESKDEPKAPAPKKPAPKAPDRPATRNTPRATDTGDETERLRARAPAPTPAPTKTGRAEIPGDSDERNKAPAAKDSESAGLTNTERVLLTTASALPQIGRGLRALRGAGEASRTMTPAFRALPAPTKALPAPAATKALPAPTKALPAPAAREAASEAPKLLTGPMKALPAPARAAEAAKPAAEAAKAAPKKGPPRMSTRGTKKPSESPAVKQRRMADEARERAYDERRASDMEAGFKRGGAVKGYKAGGSVRGDGICSRGKTKGRFV